MRRIAVLVLFAAACGGSNPSPPPSPPPTPQSMPPPDAGVTVDASAARDLSARPADLAVSNKTDASSVIADMAMPAPPPDLSPMAADMTIVIGPPGGSACTTSCDCGSGVCYGNRCVSGSWANQGHPATVAFECCDFLKSTGQCTSSTGCQQSDGKIVNCAGADCTTLSCSDMWACEAMGCGAFVCDSTTHMCK